MLRKPSFILAILTIQVKYAQEILNVVQKLDCRYNKFMEARLEDYFPPWTRLSEEHRKQLERQAVFTHVPKGRILHDGNADCIGVITVFDGQLRAYITSSEGKEVSLFRLFKRDICLLSASCMLADIQFEITLEAEKDTAFWLIPADVYRKIMQESAVLANYTNSIMASRFSDVMWLVEQMIFKSMDERLALFLLDESDLESTDNLQITHERIAHHLGSAREVISRLLQYFQNEGAVELKRGGIVLTNKALLESRLKKGRNG